MRNAFILVGFFFAIVRGEYFIGKQGQSCNEVCFDMGMNCNYNVFTNNSVEIFQQLGIDCQYGEAGTIWWAPDQPSYVSETNVPSYNTCVGYVDVPDGIDCGGMEVSVRRLCNCDAPSNDQQTFGIVAPTNILDTTERMIFEHFVAQGDVGVMTHLWVAYWGDIIEDAAFVRYYIDGEETASIQFFPSMANGVGFHDTQGPWGTKWFGKGSLDGSWFNNFRIPFQKSIRVTIQAVGTDRPMPSGYWVILRGAYNIPITVGGVTLPSTAKMNLFHFDDIVQPLEYVPLVNLTSGAGVHWMSTLAVSSGTLNFLEGCYRAFFNGKFYPDTFPGMILSTGTEDYYDSGWYFNAGEFHMPVSGFTHFAVNESTSIIQWSAYRFHDQDPLFFNDGFQLVWRNGDTMDAIGRKCMMKTGGTVVGNPTVSDVSAYAWVYTW